MSKVEGHFKTNICTLTLTLYFNEQLFTNGHGFHAQLLQPWYARRMPVCAWDGGFPLGRVLILNSNEAGRERSAL